MIKKNPIYIEPMTYIMAEETVAKMLCSTCYHHLINWGQVDGYAAGMALVLCSQCGESTRGFVSRYWVEQKLQNDAFAYRDMKEAYPDLVPEDEKENEDEGLSAEEIAETLGF